MGVIGYFRPMPVKTLTHVDTRSGDSPQGSLFLPNFCSLRSVFGVVVIAELFAIVLALVPNNMSLSNRWYNLAMISMFLQWVGLGCTALHCLSRPYMVHLNNRQAGLFSYLLMLLVVLLMSEIAYWLLFDNPFIYTIDSHAGFLLRNLLVGAIVGGLVLRYFYMQHQWRRRIRTESQARLQALQSRIRPHFLFNSMNTIASLTRSDPVQAEQAVEDLADLFRMSLGDARQNHRLEDELSLCRRYLDIEALRLGERLRVDWHMDDLPKDALMPPLLLQPLLENAVYHGIETLRGGGVITVSGTRRGGQLRITVSNPYPAGQAKRHQKGNHLALENIRERLEAVYGTQAGLLVSQQDGQYAFTVYFPYRSKDDEDPHRG